MIWEKFHVVGFIKAVFQVGGIQKIEHFFQLPDQGIAFIKCLIAVGVLVKLKDGARQPVEERVVCGILAGIVSSVFIESPLQFVLANHNQQNLLFCYRFLSVPYLLA